MGHMTDAALLSQAYKTNGDIQKTGIEPESMILSENLMLSHIISLPLKSTLRLTLTLTLTLNEPFL